MSRILLQIHEKYGIFIISCPLDLDCDSPHQNSVRNGNFIKTSVADPDPGTRIGKNPDPMSESEMKNSDNIFESLETMFRG